MTLTYLVSALRRWAKIAEPLRYDGLHSVTEFRRVLTRERARSDRSGDRFCLLVLSPRDVSATEELPECLPNILQWRLRATDEAGWFDGRSIGIVLPATPPRGAWKLAEDVCQQLSLAPQPLCRVFCYPSDASQLDRSISNGHDDRSVERLDPAAVDRNSSEAHRPVEALELLFVQSLPVWKRAADVVGSAAGLIALSPVFLILALAVKFSSPGPVFFRQWRTGRGGRRFLMYKFRSMVIDAETRKQDLLPLNELDGPAFKLTGDPRVTRLGRFLRDTSLDELPQLWNVLRGEMSLVGPRPLPCEESDSCLDWQRRRLDVTPGLTCIWQVRGRSQVTFNEWVRMDLEYVQNRSLWQDFKILLKTVPAVIQRRGAK